MPKVPQRTRGDQTTTYQYDPLDRLTRRNTATFTYAGFDNNLVAIRSGNSETLITRDPAGTPVAERVGTGTAKSLLTDTGHADVTTTFDVTTGDLTGSRSYSPFGEQSSWDSAPR